MNIKVQIVRKLQNYFITRFIQSMRKIIQKISWMCGRREKWIFEKWDRSFCEHDTVVAAEDGQIVGFGDMDDTGYLDRLYVHAKYQRRGIASAICDQLERKWLEQKIAGKNVSKKIITHASITARPFFEKRGYRVVKEQQVNRQGILLINYVMEKE